MLSENQYLSKRSTEVIDQGDISIDYNSMVKSSIAAMDRRVMHIVH